MQQTTQTQIHPISKAIEKELAKIPVWKLMMHIHGKGEISAYQIGKGLGWSSGKTHSVIKSLEKSNAVETRMQMVNNRAVKFVKLVE